MPVKNYRKSNARLYNQDIYSAISKNSSLTISQVKECFDVYATIVTQLCLSDNREEGFTIPLPKLGQFQFVVRKGRKKGSTYTLPKVFGHREKIGEFENLTITLDKDETNYEVLKLKISDSLYNKLKEHSRKRYENNQ